MWGLLSSFVVGPKPVGFWTSDMELIRFRLDELVPRSFPKMECLSCNTTSVVQIHIFTWALGDDLVWIAFDFFCELRFWTLLQIDQGLLFPEFAIILLMEEILHHLIR